MFGSLQMDEVADPIILAYQLGDYGSSYFTSVKELAGDLVANGPATPEERWEEAGGYSPATMAAEIALAVRRVHRHRERRHRRRGHLPVDRAILGVRVSTA